jgi:hypothetical protein
VNIWQRLLAVDRRIIFALVAIAIVIPFFMRFAVKVGVTPQVQAVYDYIKKLPPGSLVMISCDYDPPSAPELQPMTETMLKHFFLKDLKVIMLGLWPQGSVQANIALAKVMEDTVLKAKNLKYGIDYVNLGFTAGNEFVIIRMGTDMHAAFPVDFNGKKTSELPLMQNVRNFDNIAFVFNVSAGYPGTYEWVIFGVDRYRVKLAAGNTAVQAPLVSPYVQTGQLIGLLGGMRGAAEYEEVSHYYGKATGFMRSQTFSHAVVIFFIIVGNLAYFMTRGKRNS